MMRRREFITLLGGTAAAWPLAARAQSGESMRRVGVLTNLTHNDPEGRARDDAFVQGLKELGWIESGNLRIIRRWTEGDPSAPANMRPSWWAWASTPSSPPVAPGSSPCCR